MAAKPRKTTREATTLGQNVKQLRQRAGLSQQELAERSGLSRATVAQVEVGRYGSTGMNTVEALAKGLGVAPPDLLIEPVGVTPAVNVVEEFIKTRWYDAVQPTSEELSWLGALPGIVWSGTKPSAEAVAEMLLWRRRNYPETKPKS